MKDQTGSEENAAASGSDSIQKPSSLLADEEKKTPKEASVKMVMGQEELTAEDKAAAAESIAVTAAEKAAAAQNASKEATAAVRALEENPEGNALQQRHKLRRLKECAKSKEKEAEACKEAAEKVGASLNTALSLN